MEIVEFDDTKQYSLEELNIIKAKAYEIVDITHDKITKLEIQDYNFEGKFIYYNGYGYMYVTWQRFDSHSIHGDRQMFFQGMCFNAHLGEYRDDAYASFDALREWYIPIETFKSDVKEGRIKEISKQEFIDNAVNTVTKLPNEIKEWTEYLVKSYNYRNSND